MSSTAFSACAGPGGTSLHICASSPCATILLAPKTCSPLAPCPPHFPSSAVFSQRSNLLSDPVTWDALQPKPNIDSLSQDALDLLYFAWDVFTAFQHSSIKPNEPLSVYSSGNRHFQLPKQELRYNENCLFSVQLCAQWWRYAPNLTSYCCSFHIYPFIWVAK